MLFYCRHVVSITKVNSDFNRLLPIPYSSACPVEYTCSALCFTIPTEAAPDGDGAAEARVEDVADAVTEQIERQHSKSNRQAGEQHQPPRRHQAGVQRVRQHIAPGRRRRRDADPEKAEGCL